MANPFARGDGRKPWWEGGGGGQTGVPLPGAGGGGVPGLFGGGGGKTGGPIWENPIFTGTGMEGSPFTYPGGIENFQGNMDKWFGGKDHGPRQDYYKDIQRPEFQTALGPDGNLNEKYRVTPEGLKGDYSMSRDGIGGVAGGSIKGLDQIGASKLKANTNVGYDPYSAGTAQQALTARATSQGDSPWLQMALGKQGLEEQSARDMATRQSMSGMDAARSSLGMKGGLRSGAAERIARSGAQGLNAARSTVAREGAIDRMGLGMADDQMKMGLLGQASGLEANVGLANAGNQLKANDLSTRYGMDQEMGNVGMGLDAQKFNATQDFNKQAFNIGTGMDAQKFNAGQNFAANQFDAGAMLGKDQFNSNLDFAGQQYNMGNTLGAAGLGGQNIFNMEAYKEKMGGAAAQSNAQAIERAGKK